MELPIRFPCEADVIYAEAQAFRRLSPGERIRAIVDLAAAEAAFVRQSPHYQAGVRLRQAEKDEWQRIHRELFARHGR
jgi:hypothetical protein